MKTKHLEIRKQQCKLISQASTCPRRQVGALILDPSTNSIVSEGYNGPPRGASGSLCGGHICERVEKQVKSGTQNDIGCHHAEMNAILNASRVGTSTQNKWLFTLCDPCLMCAKAIHHAGIVEVFTPLTSDVHREGLEYLRNSGVKLTRF
jgi:dCMP deaminase